MDRFVEPSTIRHLRIHGVPYSILPPFLRRCHNIQSIHLDECGYLASESNEAIDLRTCTVRLSTDIDVFRRPIGLCSNITEMVLYDGYLGEEVPMFVREFSTLKTLRLSLATAFISCPSVIQQLFSGSPMLRMIDCTRCLSSEEALSMLQTLESCILDNAVNFSSGEVGNDNRENIGLSKLENLTIWLESVEGHPAAPPLIKSILEARSQLKIKVFGSFASNGVTELEEWIGEMKVLQHQFGGRLDLVEEAVEVWFL